ncbi:suppressor of fused domain protein [Luteolibacter sp. Populi]|uniref:suppressor of fused domain protein n=1 Tax=Luteolibacter sp. Populi TaxID=3230487 RepID=UPI003465BBF1
MKKRIEQYIEHIEDICGGEGRFFKITDEGENPPITVVAYDDVPEPGCVTAFSYGLSLPSHPKWIHSRPELVISVDSHDVSWPLALGEVIRTGRNKSAFIYGSIIHFGCRVSDESTMDSFLVYACTVLDEKDQKLILHDQPIQLAQLYPIYSSEADVIEHVGPHRFLLELGEKVFDPRRAAWKG